MEYDYDGSFSLVDPAADQTATYTNVKFPGVEEVVSYTEMDSDNALGSKGTNVTLSDDEDPDGDDSSEGEEENSGDNADQASEHNSSEEDSDSGEDEASTSSGEDDGEGSTSEEEEGDDDGDESGLDEKDESEDEEEEECSSSEGEESESENDDGSEVDEENESVVDEENGSDVDEENESQSGESSDEESIVKATIVDESESDDYKSSDSAYNSEDDGSDSSVNRPRGSRVSWLSAPPAAFKNKTNRRKTSVSPSMPIKSASRFKQWMGRKKAPAVSIIKPKPLRKRQSLTSLNQERWQSNMEDLKAFKARYGDTNVPSAYGSLGTFVRNTRALYKMPDHPKSWTLTEDRRQMLDKIDFQWALSKLKTTHAYRIRSRNITRAAYLINEINKYGTRHQDTEYEGDSNNRKSNISKQMAQHVINIEMKKLKPWLEGKEGASQVDLNMAYHEALLTGVTELDLFNSFEEIGQGCEVEDEVDLKKYPHLSLRSSQKSSSFQEWLSDRKGNWKQQQQHRKRKLEEDQQPQPVEEVETEEELGRPKLLSGRWQSEKGFEIWLADRKRKWKDQQQKKWAEKACVVGDNSVEYSIQTFEEFQHWLADRKVTWREQRQRKRRKTHNSTPEVNTVSEIILPAVPINEKQHSQKVALDFRTSGVRQTASGKWEVGFRYQGVRRSLGTFDTQDQAALANEIGRQKLITEKCSKLTVEEINENVKLARDAALNAVYKSRKKVKQKVHLDYRTVGVRQTPSGKWAVEISHKSKLRHIGTFQNQDQAAMANKIARESLKTEASNAEMGPEESSEETEEKVKLARDAALEAVSKLEVSAHTQSSPEGVCVPLVRKVMPSKTKKPIRKIKTGGKEKKNKAVAPKEADRRPIAIAKSDDSALAILRSAPTKRKSNVPAGLRRRASGKWEVVTYYHGKKRQIGTFSTREQGFAANEIARAKLKTEKGLSEEEIEQNVKLARKAALDAASRLAGDSPVQSKVSGLEDDTTMVKSRAAKRHVKPATVTLAVDGNQQVDFKSVGVRQTPSGNWEVGFRYHGNRRNLGTFNTQDQAALANEVGRKILDLTKKGTQITAEDIERNVKLAREAALEAVQKMDDVDDTPPNEEDMFKILLLSEEVISMEAGDRPKLLPSRLQSHKGFESWLAGKKNRWSQQHQRKQAETKQAPQKRSKNTHARKVLLTKAIISKGASKTKTKRAHSKLKTKQSARASNIFQALDL